MLCFRVGFDGIAATRSTGIRVATIFGHVSETMSRGKLVWLSPTSVGLFQHQLNGGFPQLATLSPTNMAPRKWSLSEETDLPGTLPQVLC